MYLAVLVVGAPATVLGTAWLQFAHRLIGQFIVIGLGLVVLVLPGFVLVAGGLVGLRRG